MIRADFAVHRVGLLATLAGPLPRTGAAMRDLGIVEDAALAAAEGRIVWLGPDRELAGAVRIGSEAEVLDAEGAAVLPGFVDAHTHLAFAGDRDEEVRRRLAGATYQEIAAAGRRVAAQEAAARAFIPASDTKTRWSAERARSSAASSAPPVEASSSACTRSFIPRARAASRTRRLSATVKTPSSQKTSQNSARPRSATAGIISSSRRAR